MRVVSPELIKRLRRADLGVRTIIEGIEVVQSDIIDTNGEWKNRADALTNVKAVRSGGLRLTGSDTTIIESATSDTNYVTDLDLTHPLVAVEVEWGKALAKETELHNFDARLVAQRVGGNPKTVAYWRCQLFRAVIGNTDLTGGVSFTLAPISGTIEVAATGGTTPITVTFPVVGVDNEDLSAFVGDGASDDSDDEADRDNRPRTFILVWALRSDGTAADNVGWEVDSLVDSITTGANIARRAGLEINQNDRINNRGVTEVSLSGYEADIMRFALRGRDYAAAQTVTYSAVDKEITLGATPLAANRLEIVAEGQTRSDSSLTFEINDGVAGWLTCYDGDRIGEDNTTRGGADLSAMAKQATYDVRVTLTPSSDGSATPIARRFGVTESIVEDLDGIATIDNDVRWSISPDSYQGEIAEATVSVLKDGQTDYADWASELLATRYINEFFFRVYIGSTNLDRQHWLHIDDFYPEDYEAGGASIDFLCITALSRIRQILPVYDVARDRREVLEYGGETLKDASDDLFTGQAEVAGRLLGPGIEDEVTTVTKRIEDSDAKVELDALAQIAGGGYTTSQGRIVFKDITTQFSPQYEFDAEEIAWTRIAPGFTKRLPEFFVPYSWLPDENRFDGEVRSFHTPSLTNLGLATIETTRTLDRAVSQWIDTQALAQTVAKRRTELQGSGLMLWEFEAILAHPELEVGDVIRIPTDRFVGRDPSAAREIRGNAWVTAVITQVTGHWGRRFQIWVRGFDDIIPTESDITRSKYGTNQVVWIYERPQSVRLGTASIQGWKREISYAGLSAVRSVGIQRGGYLEVGDLDTGPPTPVAVPAFDYHANMDPSTTVVDFLRAGSSNTPVTTDAVVSLDDTNNGLAGPITVPAGRDKLDSVTVKLTRVGDPAGLVSVSLYTDSPGLPSGLLATAPFTRLASSIALTETSYVFTFDEDVVAADVLWIAVEYPDGDATNYIDVGVDGVVSGGDSAVLNGSWAALVTADFYVAALTTEPDVFTVEYDENNIQPGGGGSFVLTVTPYDAPGAQWGEGNAGTPQVVAGKAILDYDDIGIRFFEVGDRRYDRHGETAGNPGAGATDLELDDVNQGYAFDFTPAEDMDLGMVAVYLKKIASPDGPLLCNVYATSGGLPTGAALGTSEAIAAAALPTSYDTNKPYESGGFIFTTAVSLTGGTLYHIAFEEGFTTAVNKIAIAAESSGSHDVWAGSWSAGSANTPTWRVYAREDLPRVAHAGASAAPGQNSANFTGTLNLATGLLEFGADDTGGVGGGALDDLSDVTLTADAEGQILYRNATEFVNVGTLTIKDNGTVTAPAYSFLNNTSTGMWYSTNLLNFRSSGGFFAFEGAASAVTMYLRTEPTGSGDHKIEFGAAMAEIFLDHISGNQHHLDLINRRGEITFTAGINTSLGTPGTVATLFMNDSGGTQPQILAAGSTAALPIYSFIDEPGDGMWMNGSNLAFSSGGVEVMRLVNSTFDQVLIPGGSSNSFPGLAFLTDSNCGFYHPAGDEIGIAANTVRIAHNSSVGNPTLKFYQVADERASISFVDSGDLFQIDNDHGAIELRPGTGGAPSLVMTLTTTEITAAQELRGVDGVIGTPMYSFTSETDSGVYWRGAGVVGVTASGELGLDVSDSSVGTGPGITVGSTLMKLQSDVGALGNGALRIQSIGSNTAAILTLMPSGTMDESYVRLYNHSDPANTGGFEIGINAGTAVDFTAIDIGTGPPPTLIACGMHFDPKTDNTYDLGVGGVRWKHGYFYDISVTNGVPTPDPIFMNDTANANMTHGVTVDQGATDDEVMSFQSSDVAHGMTVETETDTYGFIKKVIGAGGGMMLAGVSDLTDVPGVQLKGYQVVEDSTTNASGTAAVEIVGWGVSGTGRAQLGVGSNILAIRDGGTGGVDGTVLLVNAEGDVWAAGDITAPNFIGTVSTAGVLSPGANINGILFTGGGNITVAAAAGTLTGATLAAGVTASSLQSVGVLSILTVDSVQINSSTITTTSGNLSIDPAGAGTIQFNGSILFTAGAITGVSAITATTFNGALNGNASTATSATSATSAGVLSPGRTINGVLFTGAGNITVPAAAGTLTGSALATGVTTSSLQNFGTITSDITLGSGAVIYSTDGSAADNGHSFAAEHGMGMFRVTTGILGFAAFGIEYLRLDYVGSTSGIATFDNTQVGVASSLGQTSNTINWDLSNVSERDNTGARTIVQVGTMREGFTYILYVQYVSGSTTGWTWTSVSKWVGGTAPIFTTTSGHRTVVCFGKFNGEVVGWWFPVS